MRLDFVAGYLKQHNSEDATTIVNNCQCSVTVCMECYNCRFVLHCTCAHPHNKCSIWFVSCFQRFFISPCMQRMNVTHPAVTENVQPTWGSSHASKCKAVQYMQSAPACILNNCVVCSTFMLLLECCIARISSFMFVQVFW